jgi:hypothetical protein
MIEWLLLDRIDAKPRAPAIRRKHHLTTAILANKTETPIALFEMTFARTKIADDPSRINVGMPPISDDTSIRQAAPRHAIFSRIQSRSTLNNKSTSDISRATHSCVNRGTKEAEVHRIETVLQLGCECIHIQCGAVRFECPYRFTFHLLR